MFDKVKVFINGVWVGITEEPESLYLMLKDKKYKDTPANRIALAQIEMFEQQLKDPTFGAEYVKETQNALKDPRVFKTKTSSWEY